MKRFREIVIVVCCVACAAAAQNGKTDASSSSQSNSNSNSGATAQTGASTSQGGSAQIVNNAEAPGSNRQFIPAAPGVPTPGPFPGGTVFLNNSSLGPSECFTLDELRGFAKHNKLKGKMQGAATREMPENNDPICTLTWWPLDNSPKPIKVRTIWNGVVLGNSGAPPEPLLMHALLAAKQSDAHARGCAVRDSVSLEMVTKARSFGFGGSSATLFGNESKGTGSAAIGYEQGSSRTKAVPGSNLEVACIDIPADGPFDWSPVPATPAPPAENETNKDLVDVLKQLRDKLNEKPAPPTGLTAQVVRAANDPCPNFPSLKDNALYFNHYDATVRDVIMDGNRVARQLNRNWFANMHTYLEENRACRVEFMGGASSEGSNKLNDHLGADRARGAYSAYVARYSEDKSQVCLRVSAGKDLAREDSIYWQDRKVVAVPVGRSSDGSPNLCGQ